MFVATERAFTCKQYHALHRHHFRDCKTDISCFDNMPSTLDCKTDISCFDNMPYNQQTRTATDANCFHLLCFTQDCLVFYLRLLPQSRHDSS